LFQSLQQQKLALYNLSWVWHGELEPANVQDLQKLELPLGLVVCTFGDHRTNLNMQMSKRFAEGWIAARFGGLYVWWWAWHEEPEHENVQDTCCSRSLNWWVWVCMFGVELCVEFGMCFSPVLW
jgi:hypothetical protein